MNVQKLLVTTLIGGVFAFFFGWLVFGIIFKDSMPTGMAGVLRPEADMVMWAMILSNLLWGLLLAYIFIEWAHVSDWMGGLKAGALLGLLIAASYDTGFYAMTTLFSLKDIIMDAVLNTFFVGIMGAVVGWWLGRK
jgi:hypothetical protein